MADKAKIKAAGAKYIQTSITSNFLSLTLYFFELLIIPFSKTMLFNADTKPSATPKLIILKL
ncbi:hypothetical protein [Alkaliphilus metalliredigens]|uniref:hypothetical protein n=1 Tax=Alkaliphilus metalliredigens TaxID=208226 RepID=UPI0012EEB128|nr:hypothetical protein [Alkaliphilus metalliredigens]